jgi:hypothetical protein
MKNAKITGTMLGVEDHGIMSFYLYLEYGAGGQGAGGYCLDNPIEKDGKFIKRVGSEAGMSLIIEILKVVGVDKWEDLKGEHIRVEATHNRVQKIGHFIKDKWLDFDEFFENYDNWIYEKCKK